MVFCFFGDLVIFVYLFCHLDYLFGPLDSVYWTSSVEKGNPSMGNHSLISLVRQHIEEGSKHETQPVDSANEK